MTTPTISDSLIETCRAAAQAGADVLKAACGAAQVYEKGPADFVTEVDVASQQAIVEVIRARYPRQQIIGEEGTNLAELTLEAGDYWLIDPLDGTTNFIHQLPHYAVSVAWVVEGVPRVGCTIDPLRDEQFWASSGQGAWLNDERMSASGTTDPAQALIAISLPAVVEPESSDVRRLLDALQTCRAVRRLGAATLNLAYVAAGRLDAYWASSLQPWDAAVGKLMIEESHGLLTGIDGQPFELSTPHLLCAGSAALHASLLELVQRSA